MFDNVKKFFDIKNILLLSFAFITSLFNCIGSEFETGYLSENFSILVFLLKLLFCTIIIFFAASVLTNFLCKINIKKDNNIKDSNKFFILSFIIIFLLWFIVLLAYYPGILSYDSYSQIRQFENGFVENHPIIHTLYINFFYRFIGGLVESKSIGVLLATIIQMLFFDYSLSTLNRFLYRFNIDIKLLICLILFEAVLPIFSVLAISHTKDVFFSAFFVLFITENLNYIYKKEYFNSIIYLMSIVGFMVFRNQGIYILIVYLIYIFISKQSFKNIINKFTLYGFITGIIILLLLRIVTHAKPGRKAEIISVPAQAIGRINKLYIEDFDEYTKEVFRHFLRETNEYGPFQSDYIKHGLMSTDMPDFIYILKKTVFKYPYEYLLSAYLLDIGYLYINDLQHAHLYKKAEPGEYRSYGGYFMTGIHGDLSIKYDSKIPWLEKKYEDLFAHEEYQNTYIIKYLFSPALYFYLLFYSFILTLIKRKNELYNIYVFIILFILTLMVGASSLIRYALPYISVTIPMFLVSITNKNDRHI